MKTLTVRQPWAWAIIHGSKRIENRSRPTKYRGPLLIHAGQTRAEFKDSDYSQLMPGLPPVDDLPFGAIIGVVDVIDCLPVEDVEAGPFVEGPWCWMLKDPRPLGPIPWRGQLGLFEADPPELQGVSPSSPATILPPS